MNLTFEAAPKCQISPDGNQVILGEWTNAPGSSTSSGDSRKNGGNFGNSQIGGASSSKVGGQNNALSSALSSNLTNA